MLMAEGDAHVRDPADDQRVDRRQADVRRGDGVLVQKVNPERVRIDLMIDPACGRVLDRYTVGVIVHPDVIDVDDVKIVARHQVDSVSLTRHDDLQELQVRGGNNHVGSGEIRVCRKGEIVLRHGGVDPELPRGAVADADDVHALEQARVGRAGGDLVRDGAAPVEGGVHELLAGNTDGIDDAVAQGVGSLAKANGFAVGEQG